MSVDLSIKSVNNSFVMPDRTSEKAKNERCKFCVFKFEWNLRTFLGVYYWTKIDDDMIELHITLQLNGKRCVHYNLF